MTNARFSQGHHESVLASHGVRTAQDSAAYLLPSLRPGMRVLDVGCGPGTITLDLAALVGSTGLVVGIEPSEAPLGVARRNAEDRGDARTRFEVGDVFALDEALGRFDVVHAHQVLQHVGDPVAALRAMAAATVPGGLVAARDVDYGSVSIFPELPELGRWLALYRAVARALGTEPDAGRRMRAWAEAAGFEGATVTASVWAFADPSSRAWWGGMWSRRILESDIARHAVELGLADRPELEAISRAWSTWASSPDGWIALTHGEVLARTPTQA
ncbi:class I SAM-dependent methyltransferase [Pseudoclavibacter chungangensis]|uniref:Class I SAM-dependent methyltransferase n=1 Tax=Pseudoclavibacter chungangensis TaxID=587635 RepID=A0A7J5C0F0_9MICO|nr:class I SAM-dependent methyltransferase [Pseudoclavibacter chungangensis]KAB1660367.1 class I SAM-dependent methyltransferase [Pseudoclavibacter chungangensis]NYJ65728.1 2-polyprenyl-3-methyl-5-hydroxy-6-metoxy-1,4-benzoquinol methylase [Pseudoclavibacter chungangensis]